MNCLNKRKKTQERIQAPTYAAEVLEPFYISIMTAWKISITTRPWQRKVGETLSATAIASASLASMSTGILIDIEQSPILHPEQPSAENFFCFSGQNAQSNFLQQRAPWNHPFLFQEKGGAWSALITEERIECMHVQEEVEGQHVNFHKFFPSLLILVICKLSDAYKFLSGSVRFLVHKYVNRRARRSQSEYISEKKNLYLPLPDGFHMESIWNGWIPWIPYGVVYKLW